MDNKEVRIEVLERWQLMQCDFEDVIEFIDNDIR